MGSIIRDGEGQSSQGHKDQQRYFNKIKESIRKQLPTIVSNAPIVTGKGQEKVRIRVKAVDLPRFIYGSDEESKHGVGQGDSKPGDVVGQTPGDGEETPGTMPGEHEIELSVDQIREMILEELGLQHLKNRRGTMVDVQTLRWNTQAKQGSHTLIDSKSTLKRAIARAKAMGQSVTFPPDVFRYQSWTEHLEPKRSAVVYLLRDISGSMTDDKKYLARTLAMLVVMMLQTQYDQCAISFWVHDTIPTETDEMTFIGLTRGGGTIMAPAYREIYNHSRTYYPENEWNRYLVHFTDGDMFDYHETERAIIEMLPSMNQIAMAVIQPNGIGANHVVSKLEHDIPDPFVVGVVKDAGDILDVLKKFFTTEVSN